jgi:hypothetical protein
MKFSWTDRPLQGESIETIEENIENEISHLLSANSRKIADLTVVLSRDLAAHQLHGLARTPDGKIAVSFSYSLRDGHLAKYESHPEE